MFKSKLNFKVFDKRDRSTTHLTTVVMKNRARACCGRLSNRKGETTPFHLILDYFDDQPGEPKGHFIDFGNHTTLAKHFSSVETKPGGQQKRFSIGVKQVAVGVAFVDEQNGKEVVFLVPLQSQIPTSGWSKFLKKAKPLFGNRVGVVLTEKEWKAMQAPQQEDKTDEFAAQLAQFNQELSDLLANREAVAPQELELKLATHKPQLQQFINQYNKNKNKESQLALQEVIALWKMLTDMPQT
jgi:hypothetical protein